MGDGEGNGEGGGRVAVLVRLLGCCFCDEEQGIEFEESRLMKWKTLNI